MEKMLLKKPEVLALLARQGKSISSLAEALNLSPSHAWRMIHGERSVPAAHGRAIAKYLGVPLDKISMS